MKKAALPTPKVWSPEGVTDFELEYIEGGILSARAKTADGTAYSLKCSRIFNKEYLIRLKQQILLISDARPSY